MPKTSIATYMAKYSRYAAGSQTIRAASASFGSPVEFVLLDDDRSVVVAALPGAVLQPRKMTPAEQALLTGSDIERTEDSIAVRVNVPDNVIAALSMPRGLNTQDKARLSAFANELSAALLTAAEQPAALPGFESAVLAGLRDAIIVLDQDLCVTWASDGVVTLSGWGPNEVIGRHFASLIHPDDLDRAAEAAANLAGGHHLYRLNLRVANAFGDWVPVSITGFDHSADPSVGGIVLSVRNDERELENQRELDRTRLISSTILQSLHEAVIATDDVGRITVINDAARRLFSIHTDAAITGLSVADIGLLDWQSEPLDPVVHPLRQNGRWFDQELRVATPIGIKHLTVNRSEVQLEETRSGLVVTFHDITQARSDARELRNRALHDQLTGLANRRYLAERLQTFESNGADAKIAACFIDIDKFKTVNDTHGHRVGDTVLRATADRLRRQIRDCDILARTGGDEFLVILVDPESEKNAIEIADRIRKAFDLPFEVDGRAFASHRVGRHRLSTRWQARRRTSDATC